MAEYIEREILLNTLDKVCRVACPYSERRDIAQYVKCGACPLGSAFDFIDDIPAADVVKVIRCKDCRFFTPSVYSDDWCSAKSPGVSKGMYTPSGDSYCSDAERMTDDV